MKPKKIKDPLYGYICIPSDVMNNIIDSASFQRLRRISQTSYAPLYSSAVHNRFVHSLGVYHLGIIAGNTLIKEIEKKQEPQLASIGKERLYRMRDVFFLACLLHDVGHAPFSHTGEDFYLDEKQEYGPIHKLLKEAVDFTDFSSDIPATKSKSAAAHEIMSAIIGIREFKQFFNDNEEKAFFARCITGYKYSVKSTENSIRNCFIQLLNSKVIDVDKLDYLIRDAYITGYDTVKIDYLRLLSAITIVNTDNNSDPGNTDNNDSYVSYELAYYKSAISVIENVIYAHDSERKWIQNHPVILYESYILQHVMKMLSKKLDTKKKKLFSADALSSEGIVLKKKQHIRLLSDDDIVFLMKKYYNKDSLVQEFFNRNKRRHPMWKSETEYKALFLDQSSGGTIIDNLENEMAFTANYISKNTDNWLINDNLAKKVEDEINELSSASLDSRTEATQRKEKAAILKIVKCLTEYAKTVGYNGDFILIKASQFNSGFLKPDFSKTKIVFSTKEKTKIVSFSEKVSSIAGIGSMRDKFFYVFYKRQDGQENIIDVNSICENLFVEFSRR